MAQQMVYKRIYHGIEKFAFLCVVDAVLVATFTVNTCSSGEINAKNASFHTNLSKDLPDGFAVFVSCHHHARLQSRGLFQHAEQVATVEKSAFAKLGQVFTACYDTGFNFHIANKVLPNVHRWVCKHYLQM